MAKNSIIVNKFGGNSLKDAEAYRQAAKLLSGEHEAIVVSAAAETTAELQNLLDLASKQLSYEPALLRLQQFQQTLITELINKENTPALLEKLNQDFVAIKAILTAVQFVEDYQTVTRDTVLGFGEIWSARLMANYLNNALFIDASEILIVEWQHGIVNIDWQRSAANLKKYLVGHSYNQFVITGFIATTSDGKKTTLGENGSDFSAAIFAKLLQADQLIKWTTVDGVCSADPHKVHSAFSIAHLSYHEALELAYFGAAIIHPRAIYPVIENNIPITIRNSNNPTFSGTRISNEIIANKPDVCGLTSIDHIALINIEGAGMIGVSGVAARVFGQMHEVNISVILISQSSSEHSICFAILDSQCERGLKVLREHFAYEIEQQRIESITAELNCSILAAVGDNMVGKPGIAGKFFNMLAKANINIRAISQGSSERNISVVINSKDTLRALRAVHGGFYLSNKTISIGLIGPGGVGKSLLRQIQDNLTRLSERYAFDLRVRGIMNSKKMLLDLDAIDLDHYEENLATDSLPADVDQFVQHILAEDIPHAVIIDCTSSQAISECYLDFINSGLHLITPNKKTNSGDFQFYTTVKNQAQQTHRHYLYETTVCAGLPVIKTLQDLIDTGDQILQIEGIVSGTLGYIFDELAKGDKFSTVVLRAKQLGYTEPDPRDDLTGLDVARKFTCLARELGFPAHLEDLSVFNLVPEKLRQVSKDEFLQQIPQFDQEVQQLLAKKSKPNEKLCYVGSINQMGEIKVGVCSYPSSHPFYNLKGTDNVLVFTTKRYHQFPLVIQGPGAGTEVTAAGVFADLLRLLSFL